MLKNYFKIIFRNLIKNKMFALISVSGLSVAFCISLFLILTAHFQLTFDDFHAQKRQIFQAYFSVSDPDKPTKDGASPYPLLPALKSEFPEITAAVHVANAVKDVTFNEKSLSKNILLTDPDFLRIFSFQLIKGEKNNALKDLSDIVISENMARDIFGSDEPVGKYLDLGNGTEKKRYQVSGVIQDHPDNSSIKYDALIRSENAAGYQVSKSDWNTGNAKMFLLLADNADQAGFEQKLRPFTKRYFDNRIREMQSRGAQTDAGGDIFAIRLQNISNLHFDTVLSGGGAPVTVIYILLGIAILILLIACINFINLNIAGSFSRAKELGIRKSLGAFRKQLFLQVCGESALLCLIGFGVGILLVIVTFPALNAILNSKITPGYLLKIETIAWLAMIFIIVALLSGGYPALKMSGFNTIEVLKGRVVIGGSGKLRNSLIAVQFALSSLLICSTVVAFDQVQHLLSEPVGFRQDHLVSIPVNGKLPTEHIARLLRDKLAGQAVFTSVSGSNVNLGYGLDKSYTRELQDFKTGEHHVVADWVRIDHDFFKTIGLRMREGREFSAQFSADSLDKVIVSESFIKAANITNAIGKEIQVGEKGGRYQIVGVAPDFQLYSSKSAKKPFVMHLSKAGELRYLFVKVAAGKMDDAPLADLTKIWQEIAPGSVFQGSFVEHNIHAWYEFEQRLSRIFRLSAFVAILLSCFGLFAVAMIVMKQRTPEIGIRKILGANVAEIVRLLLWDFLKIVLWSLAFSIPVSWLLMKQWLNLYLHHITLNPLTFIGIGLTILFIAAATVSFQSIKAAFLNPVTSIKSE